MREMLIKVEAKEGSPLPWVTWVITSLKYSFLPYYTINKKEVDNEKLMCTLFLSYALLIKRKKIGLTY